MRHFEQIVLVQEQEPGQTPKTIIERRYCDGEIAYWSVLAVQFKHGGAAGQAQVPFKIDVGNCTNEAGEFDIDAAREAAFANFDAAMQASEKGAKQHVVSELQRQEAAQKTKILLAGAIPPTHIPRMQ